MRLRVWFSFSSPPTSSIRRTPPETQIMHRAALTRSLLSSVARTRSTRSVPSVARSSPSPLLLVSVAKSSPFAWARARATSAPPFKRFASSSSETSSTVDPQELQAQAALDQGTLALQRGALQDAAKHYEESLRIKETSIAHYNLGVVRYQLSSLAAAITSFERSLELSPSIAVPTEDLAPDAPLPPLTPAQVIAADTHTNLGAAYILSKPPRPELALEHLQKALAINPEDGEVCYNLAAVLEATGELEEALIAFQRAEKLGIDKAKVNIRNLGAKILGKMRKEEEEKKTAGTQKEGEGSFKSM